MNEAFKDFQKLTEKAGSYMENELSYSTKTIGFYRGSWRKIRQYMISHSVRHYNKETEKQFLDYTFSSRKKQELSPGLRYIYNGALMLTQFQERGHIDVPGGRSKPRKQFQGLLGSNIQEFLSYKQEVSRLSITRLRAYERNLYMFYQYCDEQGVNTVEQVDLALILQFIQELDARKKEPLYLFISCLRGFMGHLYDQGLTRINYSDKIPRYKLINQAKLPSTYSKEEIEKLICSVPRSTALDKRNYAIILLASRLGLRASDISRLKFDNLQWENHRICINQVKTGRELVLPLLVDVGNAIIDYLKYARPSRQTPYVFLTGRPPYRPFSTSNVVTHVVQRAFKKSGIDISGRKFGPHSLRHSLSFHMLAERTALPVITEVLGHKNSASTRYYLRIDIESMRSCLLDVPIVATDFYQQTGGVFYE